MFFHFLGSLNFIKEGKGNFLNCGHRYDSVHSLLCYYLARANRLIYFLGLKEEAMMMYGLRGQTWGGLVQERVCFSVKIGIE